MANPLDQFDNDPPALGGGAPVQSSQVAQAAQPSDPNPLDQFDNDPSMFGGPPMAAQPLVGEPNATFGSAAKQIGYGVLRAIPDAISGLADTVEKGTYDNILFHDPVTGESQFTQIGRALGLNNSPVPAPQPYQPASGAAFKSGLGKIWLNPDNLPQPQNAPERVASTAGEVAASVLAPELLFGRLGILGQTAKSTLEPLIGNGTTSSMAANTTKGLLAGTTSGAAQEAVPDQYKPIAGLVGGVAGGALGEAPGLLANMGKKALSTVPITTGQVERAAGKKLLSSAEDPDAAMNTIANAPAELVPGSAPTTGQLTGDLGLLNLERTVSRQTPEPFVERREAQNAARTDALAAIQPTGDPAEVGQFFRSQLDDIDKSTQAALDAATTNAQSAAGAIGGARPLEAIGADVRAPLQAADDAAKARTSALFKAVDPDGTANVLTSPLKNTVRSTYGNLSPAARIGVTPGENAIASVIGQYGDTMPFNHLSDVRSEISTAMREAGVGTPAYGRLAQLRGAVESTIDHTLENLGQQEAQAVSAGAMAPSETMMSKLQREANEWSDTKRTEAGAVAGSGSGGNALSGSSSIPTAPGTKSQSRGQSGILARDQGVQGAQGSGSLPEGQLLTPEQAQKTRAATAAYREYKEQRKPIEGLLKRQSYATSPYVKGDIIIPSEVWRSGPQGGQSIVNYITMAKKTPETANALTEAASQSLRTKFQDGALSEKAFKAWRTQYDPALKQLEQVAPGTLAKFESASAASRTMELAAEARNQRLDAYNKSVLGSVLKLEDPADITKRIGTILKGQQAVGKMRELASEAAKNPAAKEGLRKSVADYITQELVGNTEAGTSGRAGIKADAFQTFVRKNDAALREVLEPDEVNVLHAIAADLQRANRSIVATKIPGGSDTAQNLAGMGKHGEGHGSMFATLLGGGLGLAGGHGVVGAGLGSVIGAIRNAGYGRVDALVRDALLNPELARTLMQKVPTSKGAEISFANRLMRNAVAGGVSGLNNSSGSAQRREHLQTQDRHP